MAVAYTEISSLLSRDINHENARDLAAQACREFGSALTGYLRANLRCAEDANDLAQDVYVRITRHQDVSQIQSLKSFVFTIATNLLRDKSRRSATKLAASCVHEDDVVLQSAMDEPCASLEASELKQQLEATLGQLSPACREAYLLNRQYHFSYVAVAAHMDVSVSMVEKHISAALKALRQTYAIF